jgi:hypothetical protein
MVQIRGHVFNVDRKAILRVSDPRGSHLWDPAPSAREITGRHPVLGSQVFHPMTGPGISHPGPVTTIKPEESGKYLLLKSTRSASLSILQPAFRLFFFLPEPGPPRKLLFKVYQASP